MRELVVLLEAEHAAVYGYGVLGARLPDDLRRQARADVDAHKAVRDELVRRLRDLGVDAPGPELSYAVAVANAGRAVELAVRLETGLAVRWRDLVAASADPDLRRVGTSGLTGCAVRAARWRVAAKVVPATEALPGTA